MSSTDSTPVTSNQSILQERKLVSSLHGKLSTGLSMKPNEICVDTVYKDSFARTGTKN